MKEIKSIFEKDYRIISKDIEKFIADTLNQGKKEQKILLDLIIQRRIIEKKKVNIIDGLIFSKLMEVRTHEIKQKLLDSFPDGILTFNSSLKMDYQPLQNLLLNKKFQEADKLTKNYLCRLVKSKTRSQREWLYFTDIQFLPRDDLFTLDLLWKIYSKGKFGFSVQKKLWINNNCKWNQLWEKIGWANKGIMNRYPEEFIWTIEAPEGHLPLFNQLRGTQTLLSLFKYIDW